MEAESNGSPSQNHNVYADVEQRMLQQEGMDADALVAWHGHKSELESEIQGFERLAAGISQNPHLNAAGKAAGIAEASQQTLYRVAVFEKQVLAPLQEQIATLEKVFVPEAPSPAEVLQRYLVGNEIRAQLARMDPIHLQGIYETAIADGDEQICAAFEEWPGQRLRPLAKEKTDEGIRARLERKHPEETAQLAKLRRLRASYEGLLQSARHVMGASTDDRTLERVAATGQML